MQGVLSCPIITWKGLLPSRSCAASELRKLLSDSMIDYMNTCWMYRCFTMLENQALLVQPYQTREKILGCRKSHHRRFTTHERDASVACPVCATTLALEHFH